MAAGFTQDTVFHFLQSCGGSVKNADLLTHFRSFIRENPEQEKNRELFKRFVNSLATVQQIDGVSYVVLRKKFRGNVPGGGEQGSRVAPGKKREVFPGNGAQSLAPPQAPPQAHLPNVGQHIRGAGHPLETPAKTTPAKIAADNHMQVPVTGGQPPGRQALSQAGVSPPPETSGRKALLQSGLSPPPQTSGRQALLQAGLNPPPQTSGRQALLQSGLKDSSLLNRRDFISGFTVLHWIAKHGDHRKAGVNFDINARSTSGHTPLHIATIHGHKNIIRLLVNKFGADMRLRDMAGKKAWQYLDCAMPLDVFQLLGAPPRVALKGAGEVGKIDVARQSSRRRLIFKLAICSTSVCVYAFLYTYITLLSCDKPLPAF
uniref:SOWAHA-C winged helix-turn-helix domain-containing protein n=1 Tax=Takifugu rubripes TaxID=31033 RepID=H2RRY1_TAKRU